jgi:hypothetical protein
MAVPGIGLQSTAQFAPRSTAQRNLSKSGSNKLSTQPSKNETQSTNVSNTEQGSTPKSVLFSAVPKTTNTSESVSSRKNLTEIENFRSRFQIQESNKAVQSFLEVADLERKDELTSLLGIDIYI